ncbi:NAD(P)-binding protein [Hortaea werneckii]|nr:NAD(P)-binding protein [Hortaea werneckii]
MGNSFSQSFFIPQPTITEHNCPNQAGRVHLVTGGYTGLGKELVKILYQHNATVYVAGRNSSKASTFIEDTRAQFPSSAGSIQFLHMDLADCVSIKAAASRFVTEQKHLHVLTLNAGVMNPPKEWKTAQGHDLTMGTNCLGPHLLYMLLRPLLFSTAKVAPPGCVRVTWAGSIGIDELSPKPGGMRFVGQTPEPAVDTDTNTIYGQSKAGNLMLASVHARRDAMDGVIHVCWNPGNLKTELLRHSSAMQNFVLSFIMHPAIFGAYTELFAGVSDEIKQSDSGSYIAPWGRVGEVRSDIQAGLLPGGGAGNGVAERFVDWCDAVTADFLV